MMFWDKAYTPSQNIEALLQKEDVTVEEFLDDDDIIQECKAQKRNLVQYFTRPDVIKRLIELIITEPPEDLPLAQRFKYANMACEILTLGLPSLNEKLVEDITILKTLYSYLEQEPPLNPLLSSFFSKTFCMLIWKKYNQDWFLYQKMCLQVLEFIKSQGNFLDLIFKHFATPVIMDLLLQIIKEVQGDALKENLYGWLTEQQMVKRLIEILGRTEDSDRHHNIAEFLCELIKHCRSLRQTEQEGDFFKSSLVVSNPLLLAIEDTDNISLLLDVILNSEDKDSSIISGISVVLTLVDESIVDEPASDKALQKILDKEKENHEKVVSTVIKAIAPRLRDFHELLLNPPKKNEIVTAATKVSPPFGFTRLQICRLFTVLLKTGHPEIVDKIYEVGLVNTLLKLFKEYSWNNFLHSEVEKCFEYIFASNNPSNVHNQTTIEEVSETPVPTALQKFVIIDCKVIPKLINCWMHNRELQSLKCGRRLGYMGHLIKIFKNISTCIANSEQIGALIVSNLNEEELENWKLIVDEKNGELSKELNVQNQWLAKCNAYETAECSSFLTKDFGNENFTQFFGTIGFDLTDKLENLLDDVKLDKVDFQSYLSIPLQWTPYDPWGDSEALVSTENKGNSPGEMGFAMDDFADFDSHFSSFSNDLGGKFETEQDGGNVNIEQASSNFESSTKITSDLKDGELNSTEKDRSSDENNVSSNEVINEEITTFGNNDGRNVEDIKKSLKNSEISDVNKIAFESSLKDLEDRTINFVESNSVTNGPTEEHLVKENSASEISYTHNTDLPEDQLRIVNSTKADVIPGGTQSNLPENWTTNNVKDPSMAENGPV